MEMDMFKPSTSRTQLDGKPRRSRDQSPKKWRQPTTTQNVLKQTDGQGTLDENTMCLESEGPLTKPNAGRHCTISKRNSDDVSSSDRDIYDGGWRSQPNPSTNLSKKLRRPKGVPQDSESDGSSSVEECKSTWKAQSQPKTSRHKNKKTNTRLQSSGDIEIFESVWHTQSKTTTSILRKSGRPKKKRNSDSDSSGSLNDTESSLKPHSKSISHHKILDQNTSEKNCNLNKFKQTWNPLAKPITSHQKNSKQIADGPNYDGREMCKETLKEPTKLSVNHHISFRNIAPKITDIGSLDNTYDSRNLTGSWGSSRHIKPNVHVVNDSHPNATSTAMHMDNKQKCSILKKSSIGLQRPNSTHTNNTRPAMPEKRQPVMNTPVGNDTFSEATTPIRRSPRKRHNVPVYSAKKKLRTDALPRRGSRHPSPQVSCRLGNGSEKRRQLLQRNSRAVEDVDNNEDNSERHSPLVRGKTRSRTRYYSTVGAVHSPPKPEDYTRWRTWPPDVGLMYAEYPRDFVEPEPRLSPPTSGKEIRAHHALHCIVAIVALTTAASQRGSISSCEIMLMQFMLGKMREYVPREATPGQGAETAPPTVSVGIQIYRGVENMHVTEYTNTGSTFHTQYTFLDMFGLHKTVQGTSMSTVEEEIIWIQAVNELIRHIEHIILKNYKKPSPSGVGEEADVNISSRQSTSAQHEESATVSEMILVNLLNQLLLATSLLYSVICHTSHETVKKYIDSQTTDLVTQWMKDMLTDNP